MTLCSDNFTLGIFVRTSDKFIKLQKNIVSGSIGRYFDKYFVNKGVKNCILKPVYGFEEKTGSLERNQSFIDLVRKNQLDLYFSTENLGFDGQVSNCKSSLPIHFLKYQVAQVLAKPKEIDRTDFLSSLIYNKILFILILFGYLINLLVIGILLRTVYKEITKRSKLFSIQLFFYDIKKTRILFPKIAILLIFLSFFIFINLNLLNNSIKTNVVVIKTDEFIDSRSKLDRTTKTPVFHQGSSNYQLRPFFKLKKNFILIKPNTIGIQNLTKILNQKITSYYFFMSKTVLYITIYYTCLEYSKHNYFVYKKETNYYEPLKVFYFRTNLESFKKKILNKRLIESSEKGFFKYMYGRMEEDFYNLAKSKIEIYFDLDNFINDFAKLNGRTIIFDNYKSLFVLFYSIQSSIFILFLIVQIYKCYIKNLVKFCKKQFIRFLRFAIQFIIIQIQIVFRIICHCLSKIKR